MRKIQKVFKYIIILLLIIFLSSCQADHDDKTVTSSPFGDLDTRVVAKKNVNGDYIITPENKGFTYSNGYYDENNLFVESSLEHEFEAKWQPTMETSGYYKVYMKWPEVDDAFNQVPIDIYYNDGLSSESNHIVNQTLNANDWVLIGNYYFVEGENNYVHMKGSDDHIVYAGSVQFELVIAIEEENIEAETIILDNYEKTTYTQVVKKLDNNYELTINGEPYFVQGLNGYQELELTKELGANTIRTYGLSALDDGKLLDEAESLGLKVFVGLWMQHETSSFNYKDSTQTVLAQRNEILAAVYKYKDHPAVAGWVVGNEVDKSTAAYLTEIYKEMNILSKEIKRIDQYHVTLTALAGSSPTKIAYINRYVHGLDMLGFNSYSHIANVENNTQKFRGPYMITEFATDQPMETNSKTTWGAITERSAWFKGDVYKSRYETYIKGLKDENNVGGFAFVDTGSFRITHTWYGLIYDGRITPQYAALQSAYLSQETDEFAQINFVTLNDKIVSDNVEVASDSLVEIKVDILHEIEEAVRFEYDIRKEVGLTVNYQPNPLSITFNQLEKIGEATFNAPKNSGEYRLFAYMYYGDKYVSTYSFPFKVEGDPFVLEDQEGVDIVSEGNPMLTYEGTFKSSSNILYNGVTTKFTNEKGAYAFFRTDIVGAYEVFIYNVAQGLEDHDDRSFLIEIYYENGKVETIDFTPFNFDNEWVSLGVFTFDGSEVQGVKTIKTADTTKVVRATAIAFLPE